jgi:hypothetical protein
MGVIWIKKQNFLISEGLLSLCAEPSKIPAKSIIRRISDTKNQQGFFYRNRIIRAGSLY